MRVILSHRLKSRKVLREGGRDRVAGRVHMRELTRKLQAVCEEMYNYEGGRSYRVSPSLWGLKASTQSSNVLK
jgi:hypothetical protein